MCPMVLAYLQTADELSMSKVKALEKTPWTSQLSVNLPERHGKDTLFLDEPRCKPWERTLKTVQEKIVSDQARCGNDVPTVACV